MSVVRVSREILKAYSKSVDTKTGNIIVPKYIWSEIRPYWSGLNGESPTERCPTEIYCLKRTDTLIYVSVNKYDWQRAMLNYLSNEHYDLFSLVSKPDNSLFS